MEKSGFSKAEIREIFAETDRRIAETDRQIAETNRQNEGGADGFIYKQTSPKPR